MPSAKYRFFVSLLKHIEDIKETEKTKISIVYNTGNNSNCILRVCKGRDLSGLCEALCKTRHPNIAVVYDYVYEDGDTYILEEHINGKSVKEIMDEDGVFSERQTAEIISAVCSALEVLHTKTPPIIHNDINPSNIMICDDGAVKLFDFDISRLYQKGKSQNTELFGTEEYASPEHFGYGQSEPRTDIYCLGVTMHKMLTDNGLTDEHKITYNGKLKNIIEKCLEIDPDRRYSSVSELNKKLKSFLSKKQSVIRGIRNALCVTAIVFCCFLVFKAIGFEKIYNHDETNTSSVTSESKDSTENETSEKQSTTAQASFRNNTRETALAINPEEILIGRCEENESKWYNFSTSDNDSVYRIRVAPIDAPDNIWFPFLNVAVYDNAGIKLEEFDVWPEKDFGFLDIDLQSDTEYFVKITLGGRFNYGNFELLVSEFVCDAGSDKENATELIAGERKTGTLDSTVSDWYVFRVPEDGEYTYTIHNIDVGCAVYFYKELPNGARHGRTVSNENNYSESIRNLQKGELVYFEIYPDDRNPKANGKYIIEITENN